MLSNLRLAVRTLSKTPFVTAIAVLSLALGIGANTAIFSLMDRVLLQSLPVANPDQLTVLSSFDSEGDATIANSFSDPMHKVLRDRHDATDLRLEVVRKTDDLHEQRRR